MLAPPSIMPMKKKPKKLIMRKGAQQDQEAAAGRAGEKWVPTGGERKRKRKDLPTDGDVKQPFAALEKEEEEAEAEPEKAAAPAKKSKGVRVTAVPSFREVNSLRESKAVNLQVSE